MLTTRQNICVDAETYLVGLIQKQLEPRMLREVKFSEKSLKVDGHSSLEVRRFEDLRKMKRTLTGVKTLLTAFLTRFKYYHQYCGYSAAASSEIVITTQLEACMQQ